MTNPIEWKEADRVTRTVEPGATARLVVHRRYKSSVAVETKDATPADLAAALDAIPAGERAAVLKAFGSDPEMRAVALLTDCAVAFGKAAMAEAARDKALAERDDCFKKGVELVIELNAARKELAAVQAERDEARGQCAQVAAERDVRVSEADGLVLRLIATERERDAARERADRKAAAHSDLAVAHRKALLDLDEARKERDRVRASLDVVRHDLDGTRQELREAREARDRSARLRDAMMPDTRAELGAACDESAADAARRVVAERDSLRTRIIAAESAAAARPPREYPLAEGSPPPSIDPERLDLVRRALSGYVDPDQSPEQAARVAVEVADAALAIMRGLI